MCSLGHTTELVSAVGSISAGSDACSPGLSFILVAVTTICLTCVDSGTTTSVSYNSPVDNGTKSPGFDGHKSLDV